MKENRNFAAQRKLYVMDINELKRQIEQYRQAATDGDSEAQFQMGMCYEQENDMVNAAKWLRKAARQSGEQRAYNLGSCYYKGLGVDQSYSEAVHWFHKALKK